MKIVVTCCLVLMLLAVLLEVKGVMIEKRGRTYCAKNEKCCGSKVYCNRATLSDWCCPSDGQWYLDCGTLGWGTCKCYKETFRSNIPTQYGSKPRC